MARKWDSRVFHQDVCDPDPDKPHQALFDLKQELDKEHFVLDDVTQGSVVKDVIRLALRSSHSDVQGAAVKCIAPLVKKVKEQNLDKMVESLVEPLQKDGKEQRDIATISLKYFVEHVPSAHRTTVRKLSEHLLDALRRAQKGDAKLDILDVITDLLRRFGSAVNDGHEGLQACVLKELSAPGSRLQVRKKAILCLAVLSVHTTEASFGQVLDYVIKGIREEKGEHLRKHIQLCSAISRTAGYRLGPALGQVVPLLLDNLAEEKLGHIEDDNERNEIRENILQAFESFLVRCPQQVTKFIAPIVQECRTAISYDPYYDYDDDGADADGDVVMDDDEYDEQMDADVDDDDDVSWKVRKAGAKCLSALIEARADALGTVYEVLCSSAARQRDLEAATPSLRMSIPERFKEREESVRMDIFKVFLDLLRATQLSGPSAPMEAGSMHGAFRPRVHETRPEAMHLVDVRGFVADCLCKAARDKSMKVKTACFTIMKELVCVLRGKLEPEISKLLGTVRDALGARDATTPLKTEILQFLHLLFDACAPDSPELQKALPELLPLVVACAGDRYYKITSEALKVCGEMTPVVVLSPDAAKFVHDLYKVVHGRLSTPDVDQEVKDAAIHTMGSLLCYAASAKEAVQHIDKGMVTRSQEQFLVLLASDFSRIPVIKTLAQCKHVDMEPQLLTRFVQEISSFLKKSSRPLRQATLRTLRVLVECKGSDIDDKLLPTLLRGITDLLTDQVDLHLSHLAIDLCDVVIKHAPARVVQEAEKQMLDRFLALVKSPLLQGSALESLENVFETFVPRCSLGYQPLMEQVIGVAGREFGQGEGRQVLNSVSGVVAKMTRSATQEQRDKTIEEFVAHLRHADEGRCGLGLACLGQIGRFVNLSGHQAVLASVRSGFVHPKEDIKTLAAASLGKIVKGAVRELLPELLGSIESQVGERYLLFRALKEALSRADPSDPYEPLRNEAEKILRVCLALAAVPDEGIRNVVAECLGKLALISPALACGEMRAHAEKAGALSDKTTTIICAFKCAVTEHSFGYDGLADDLAVLLRWMSKAPGCEDPQRNAENVKTRRAAVQLFTAALHSKPELVRMELRTLMEALYSQTTVDDALVRSVNLGPFQHKVDDGIELRKSAFECMDILLDGTFSGDSLLEYLNDYHGFCRQLVVGMETKQGSDIQVLCYFMMSKLCRVPRAYIAVLSAVEDMCRDTFLPMAVKRFVDQIKKQGLVQQEMDKMMDNQKALFCMVEAIWMVPGAEDNQTFNKFLATARGYDSEKLKVVMEAAAKKMDADR
eukprot:TRINITY_DN4271_c1_g1_i1.p1 TRINITY_DN4271_c1_g1~~TRINITY_DN4271_c1_g1_i1.p1  ORF type:complete len:1290 (+),score=525.65 TRINITY_DN4271_c1_g1_i1:80-3949(+)